MFYFCFKHLLKNLNQGQYRLIHTIFLENFDHKRTYTVCCSIFPIFLANSAQEEIQFDLSFQGSYIVSFQGSKTNLYLKAHLFFSVQKFIKKMYQGQLRFDPYCPFKELMGTSTEAHILLVFKHLLKNWIYDITIWLIFYCPSKDLITNFHQKLICFWCSKIHSKNSIRDYMVWPILSLQGSYVNVDLSLTYFLVFKLSWKIVSGTV